MVFRQCSDAAQRPFDTYSAKLGTAADIAKTSAPKLRVKTPDFTTRTLPRRQTPCQNMQLMSITQGFLALPHVLDQHVERKLEEIKQNQQKSDLVAAE